MSASSRLALNRRRFFRMAAGGLAGIAGARSFAADATPLLPAMSGVDKPDLVSLDRLMTSFMTLYDIPGAALAVSRQGKLVYARGFGYADPEKKEKVEPNALFRIASISKSITAVAVLQLVERGKLHLDDKVFEILPHQPASWFWGAAKVDPRIYDITVLQLLQHTAGWDRDKSFDPMFRSVAIAKHLGIKPPAGPEHIIRYMMTKPLDFAPGMRYAYSNFGYCLLGRLIEKVTGKGYEEYVRSEVLSPIGIKGMCCGKTLPDGRQPREVRYFDEHRRNGPAVVGSAIGAAVPAPYGAWYLEAMDSHGGWIASAVDLVRFAAAFDKPSASKLLTARSIRMMFARPQGAAGYDAEGKQTGSYYGCGWQVVPLGGGYQNQFHGGALDGTATWLVRRADGMNWAVLFNTRSGPGGNYLGNAIDLHVHFAVDKVKKWPEGDLFEKYL